MGLSGGNAKFVGMQVKIKLCQFLVSLKHRGKVRYSSTHSDLNSRRGELPRLVYRQGSALGDRWIRRWLVLEAGLGVVRKEISYSYRRSNYDSSIIQPVAH